MSTVLEISYCQIIALLSQHLEFKIDMLNTSKILTLSLIDLTLVCLDQTDVLVYNNSIMSFGVPNSANTTILSQLTISSQISSF